MNKLTFFDTGDAFRTESETCAEVDIVQIPMSSVDFTKQSLQVTMLRRSMLVALVVIVEPLRSTAELSRRSSQFLKSGYKQVSLPAEEQRRFQMYQYWPCRSSEWSHRKLSCCCWGSSILLAASISKKLVIQKQKERMQHTYLSQRFAQWVVYVLLWFLCANVKGCPRKQPVFTIMIYQVCSNVPQQQKLQGEASGSSILGNFRKIQKGG